MPRTHKQTICIFDFIKLARFLNSWHVFSVVVVVVACSIFYVSSRLISFATSSLLLVSSSPSSCLAIYHARVASTPTPSPTLSPSLRLRCSLCSSSIPKLLFHLPPRSTVEGKTPKSTACQATRVTSAAARLSRAPLPQWQRLICVLLATD